MEPHATKGRTMLSEAQKAIAQAMLREDESAGTVLRPTSRRDVEHWAGSGVAGDLDEEQARRLAAVVIDDAHDLGLRYGQDWGAVIDAMTEQEVFAYVDAALR